MKISWIKQMLMALLGITMLVSCEYDFVEVATTPPAPPDTNEAKISFAQSVEPIFTAATCTDCHNSSGPFDLSVGHAYQSIVDNNLVVAGDPENSLIYTVPKPVTGSHFKLYPSAADADSISKWIFQGALNN